MKSKPIGMNILFAIAGISLFVLGGLSMKQDWFADLKALPGILIGVGCGLFAHNFGTIIETRAIESDPAQARKKRIEQKDERNQLINNAAKGKAFDAMVYIYGTVLLICTLLNVDLIVILILVGAYLLVYGIKIYQMSKLMKEM